MRKLEKNVAYESDEERNPYASSVSPVSPVILTRRSDHLLTGRK